MTSGSGDKVNAVFELSDSFSGLLKAHMQRTAGEKCFKSLHQGLTRDRQNRTNHLFDSFAGLGYSFLNGNNGMKHFILMDAAAAARTTVRAAGNG